MCLISKKEIFIDLAVAVILVFIFVFSPVGAVWAEQNPAHQPLWKDIIGFAQDRLAQMQNSSRSEWTMPGASGEKYNQQKNNNPDNVPDGNISMADVEKAAEYASEKVGVDKDYLMGELVVESALGQNTGQCTYAQVEEGAETAHGQGRLSDQAWQTFHRRKNTIVELADEQGYNYEKLKVSCNPPYAGTGGAMGVEQFMPDTWTLYRDRVVQIVGKKNPDPWNVRDGVVAMALLLSDTPGVTSGNVWAERAASKMYLSGTVSWQYNWYANEVQYWAKNYPALTNQVSV
ncbi:MAG: lytic murein transglycosylase [Candidatus Pacebacteria bacterium]|nr:lytic murein transglycosylase [Candidatus Paceibacterota bacterium]MDR3583131.1 lytic murein transglycosylase [Candidatus Paceibacterota bacterium]